MELKEVLDTLNRVSPKRRKEIEQEAIEATASMKWIPNPGPQTEAYFSKADVLLFGGEPGGGKTELILGLAFNAHKRSLLMRRQYANLAPLLEGAIRINGGRDGYNGSPPPKLRISTEQLIEFGAAARPGDEQDWQGNPHDLIGFDEGTQFLKDQVRFLMGWLRSVDPGQRCRVVIATNPPLTADGLWVVQMFAPWLDERHPRPAKPGELRWFMTDEDGIDTEVDGPDPVMMKGRPVKPLSRTFIPSSLADNPYLANTEYQSRLDAMIEPFRSILLGKFKQSIKDHPFQVIPTAWVHAAQERWRSRPRPPPGIPMCALGVDPAGGAGGGNDRFTIAPRYDWWFAPLITIPAKEVKLASQGAGHVVAARRDDAEVMIDMGGGYGGGTYERLTENGIPVQTYKGASASSKRTKDKKLGFTNKRSELYWKLREALDPDQDGGMGSPIALPDDPELTSDLTVLTYEVKPRGIQVLQKEKVVEVLGRSPDKGDAVMLANAAGPRGLMPTAGPDQYGPEQVMAPLGRRNATPKVDLGPRRRHSRR
ncbi:MAG TPA: hypothetical protein VFX20_18165 [Steroidobacteraceae bacterium]|nr:hypothetical protein [Steroidobacteraceae bacterium]